MFTGSREVEEGVRAEPMEPLLVYLLKMVKWLLIPTPSLSGMGVSVLRSGHGEEDSPSDNKGPSNKQLTVTGQFVYSRGSDKCLTSNPHSIRGRRYCSPAWK